METVIALVAMGGALLLLYQARRMQDGKSQRFQVSSRNWALFSSVPLCIVMLEGVLLAAGGDALAHLPIMLIMAGLAGYMWWQAWRLRQMGQ